MKRNLDEYCTIDSCLNESTYYGTLIITMDFCIVEISNCSNCSSVFAPLQLMIYLFNNKDRGQGWHIEKTHLEKSGFFKVGYLGFFKCNFEKTRKFGFFQDLFDIFCFFQDFFNVIGIFELFFYVQEIIKR